MSCGDVTLLAELENFLRLELEADALPISIDGAYLGLLIFDHLSAVIGEGVPKGVLLNRYLPEILILGQLLGGSRLIEGSGAYRLTCSIL